MGIALGRLGLAVTEQLADHLQGCAAADQQGREGMAQIVDVDIGKPGLLLDLRPKPSHFLHRLAGRIAGEEPWRPFRYQQKVLAQDNGSLVRNRHAVNPALFRHHGRLRPPINIEIIG